MKKYLVTGGYGVIGSIIAETLIGEGHSVSIIDSSEEPRNHWIASRLPEHRVAIGRLETMGPLLLDWLPAIDGVIHCAASTGIPYSVTQPSDDWERNAEGTRVLLEALRHCPKPTAVLSSVKPYSVRSMPREGLREDALLEPDEPYAASKAAQSMLCQAYAKSYGLPVVTFRCSNLYGPAPCHGPRHGWLTWFCIAAAIGRPIEVQGTGNQSRDMLHADDVFRACMYALTGMADLQGQLFNLGGGLTNEVSVNQAAAYISTKTGCEVVRGPARAMDDDRVIADTTKFWKASGWAPRIGVLHGIDQVLHWAKKNAEDLKKVYEGV